MTPTALLLILAAAGPWTPEISMKVQQVADVTPSPDGRWVVYSQTRALYEGEKSELLGHIWIARADGSDRWQLTRGDKSASAPRWSPDGHSVYFLSEREGKPAVFRIAIDGGEAERITEAKAAIATYEVSPNGKWIAFAGREPDPDEDRARKEKRDFHVIDDTPKNAQLWIASIEPDASGKRTPRVIGAGAYHVGAFDWSPDSRRIAFETRPTPDADNGRKADLFEVDIETGVAKPIAATKSTEAQPRYSRDGRYLAFVRSTAGGGSLDGNRIVLLTLASGQARELPATYDESPNLVDWAPDSRSIYYIEGRGTRMGMYAMPVDGPPRPLYTPAKHTLGFGVKLNASGTHAGFVRQSSSEPVEAYVLPITATEPVRVSAANIGLDLPPVGETKVVRWKAKDGKEIEGLLTLPANYEKGKKIPLILNIHGGPSGAFNETFIGASGLYPIAVFASKGWATLRPNPRGSTGYTRPFRAANLNDWGGGDYGDIMSGVDSLIAQGIADPDRMVVMGWSYGGYMTNWVVSQTNRFKAAATGAGLSNLPSMWGTNDIPTTLDDYFNGPWFEQPDAYIKMSPLFHIKDAKTPLLVLHGEVDPRVPPTQGYEMYSAMKRKGVETEMVVYPRTQHGPREPKFVLDIMQRHIAWVERHI